MGLADNQDAGDNEPVATGTRPPETLPAGTWH